MAEAATFAGKSALITGAASGIGAACARLLATQGAARLVLVDRDAEGLGTLDLACPCERVTGDVANEAMWAALEPKLAPLDLAVINAGIASGAPVADLDFAEWRRILSVNLDGAFLALRAVMRNIADGGSVVLTSSVSGFKPEPGTAAYGASKAAIIQLAKVAARRVRRAASASTRSRRAEWTHRSGTRHRSSAISSRSMEATAMLRSQRWRRWRRRSGAMPQPMKWRRRSVSCCQTLP
jgi:NAD(P)-dependent dehydrogenase (short-subunit alcohol dehydrogenase family)